ncbi:hypothetical protein DFR52_11042 [Hoeflea marina]|uniref:Patatin-like phospholipase n=1 Tax=Hoeflea marina TaxID=274592 RepID=A0A317PC89_9HYPH|nr:hypothetical protein [Hoeflea marina]PWV95513.1 hypothetical protein DFR52_11042 [Hoeflea marina]
MRQGENHNYDFAQIRNEEYDAVIKRRAAKDGRGPAGRMGNVPEGLFGIGLSGGGIRSSSFCLGVLQSLHTQGLISRLDYLSTVSGGGHIGASMVAAMSRGAERGQFPFAGDPRKRPDHAVLPDSDKASRDDVRDSEPVSHIRDHSRYLIPNGMSDILPSFAVLARGLAVNAFLILALIVPLATITVIANPTAADLKKSILVQVFSGLFPIAGIDCRTTGGLCDFPFLATGVLAAITVVYLVAWGLWRSLPERHGLNRTKTDKELTSQGTWVTGTLSAMTILALLTEVQGPILEFLFNYAASSEENRRTIPSIAAVLIAFATATAGLRGTLADWIQKAMKNATVAIKLRAIASKAIFMAAGLIVPVLIYAAYLALTLWGISSKDEYRFDVVDYPMAPSFLFSPTLTFWLAIIAGVLVLWECWIFVVRRQGREMLRIFGALVTTDKNTFGKGMLAVAAFAAFLICAVLITRTGSNGSEMVNIYLLVTAIVLMLTINFSENANGLHRLYRERLSAAFRLGADIVGPGPLLLSNIDQANAPYLLVNATLNARQRSALGPAADTMSLQNEAEDRAATTKAVEHGDTRLRETDPVKRGRNAEFFIFSGSFVGSDLTGYVRSTLMQDNLKQLDLATAVAISGAAVSSSMGRVRIGLLRPTMALLNLRLGYWMPNPRFVKPVSYENPSGRPALEYTRWYDFFRAYLIAESFGLLSDDAAKVYLTDGGHIDNIGLYQLLKRECRIIIVADAEADPAMTFGALVDAERFARIDLGVRINIKWAPIRAAALKRKENLEQDVPEDSELHDCHFAIGDIDYGEGKKGILLYVKAAVTGDEPDYVLDYERRYPSFPHESTGDQFFSEEQMEAYRALGFHAMSRALSDPDPKKHIRERPEESTQRLAELKKQLGLWGAPH